MTTNSAGCETISSEEHLRKNAHEGMVLVPAGSFLMGSDSGGPFERPMREVFLDAFWIDATPVTNSQFARFVAETGHVTDAERRGSAWGFDGREFRHIDGLSWKALTKGRDDHPVVLVSWHDAIAFATWAGKQLPTEAEWEKASLGGFDTRLYPWGDGEPDGTQCNFAARPSAVAPTRPVMEFRPNEYGLHDLVGNVWQWCQDWYADDSYSTSGQRNPDGPPAGSHRVRRGGSWNVIQPFRLRCANRGAFDPTGCALNLGFRCVLNSVRDSEM